MSCGCSVSAEKVSISISSVLPLPPPLSCVSHGAGVFPLSETRFLWLLCSPFLCCLNLCISNWVHDNHNYTPHTCRYYNYSSYSNSRWLLPKKEYSRYYSNYYCNDNQSCNDTNNSSYRNSLILFLICIITL